MSTNLASNLNVMEELFFHICKSISHPVERNAAAQGYLNREVFCFILNSVHGLILIYLVFSDCLTYQLLVWDF